MQTNNFNNDVSNVTGCVAGNQERMSVPLTRARDENNLFINEPLEAKKKIEKQKKKFSNEQFLQNVTQSLPQFLFKENYFSKCTTNCAKCIQFPSIMPSVMHMDNEHHVKNITTLMFHERRSDLSALLYFDTKMLYPQESHIMSRYIDFKRDSGLTPITIGVYESVVLYAFANNTRIKEIIDNLGRQEFTENLIFLYYLYKIGLFYSNVWGENPRKNSFHEFLFSLKESQTFSVFSHITCDKLIISGTQLKSLRKQVSRNNACKYKTKTNFTFENYYSEGVLGDVFQFVRYLYENFSYDIEECALYAHIFHKNLDYYLFDAEHMYPTSLEEGALDSFEAVLNQFNNILVAHQAPTCFKRRHKSQAESVFFPQNGDFSDQGLFSIDHNVSVDPDSASELRSILAAVTQNIGVNHTVGIDLGTTEFLASDFARLLLTLAIAIVPEVAPYVLPPNLSSIISAVAEFSTSYRAFHPEGTLGEKIIAFSRLIRNLLKVYFATKKIRAMEAEMQPQSIVTEASWVECSIIPLCSLLYYFFFKKDPSNGVTYLFKDFITSLPKLKGGVESLVSFILTVAQKFSQWLTDRFGVPRFTLNSVHPDLANLQDRFDKFHDKMRKGEPYNYDNGMILFEIEREARRLKDSISADKTNEPLRNGLNDLIRSIGPFVSRFERNNIIGNGPRVEPLAIMLGGPTAVGKSTATVPLIISVCSQILSGDKLASFVNNHNDHIWTYISENHFHDSYHGQFNTIVDEVGGLVDSVGSPDPASLFCLRMINVANFPLVMAHLEDKGNVNFRSELVWATTNRNYFDWDAMYMPKAFTRRFEVSMLTVPKIEYSLPLPANMIGQPLDQQLWSRMIDKTKLTGDEVIDLDVYEFYPWDFHKGCSVGPPISFDELVSLICEKYRAKKAKGELILDFHQRLKMKHMAKRKDEEKVEVPVVKPEEPTKATLYEEFDMAKLYKQTVESVSKAYDKFLGDFTIPEIPKSVAIASMVGLAALGIWKLFETKIFPQSGNVKHSKGNRKLPRHRMTGKLSKFWQAGVSQNVTDVAESIVRKNLYTLSVKGGPKFGYVLFIKGRIAIFPEHFIHALDNKYGEEATDDMILCIQKTNSNTSYEFKFSDCIYTTDESCQDCLFVLFPKYVHPHTNIAKFFIPLDNTLVQDKFHGGLLKLGDFGYSLIATDITPHGSKTYGSFHLDKGFMYNVGTQNGDCGAPVFLCDKRSQVPYIVGFHLYGSGAGVGGSNVIYKEVIDEMIIFFEIDIPELDEELDEQRIAQMTPQCSLDSRFTALRIIDRHRVPTESRIIRTEISDIFGPPLEAPALLRKVGDIDPWVIARSKYNCKQKYIDQDVLRVLSMELTHEIFYVSSHNDPHPPKIFTFEEAVAGIDYLDFWDSIPRNTSPGYPWNLVSSKPGKEAFFGKNDTYDFSSKECQLLRNTVEENLKQAALGKRLDVIFTDYLKDERRPHEKVRAGKTRLFSASPLHYSIMMRMYFGDFLRWLFENRIKNGFAPGVNPYSDEWKFIVEHLTSVGDRMIPGDFSAYDGSIMNIAMMEFLTAVETFYHNSTQEDVMIRRVLFWEILNSRHLAPHGNGGIIYEWVGSNCSGNPITTPLNTFCGLLLVRYAIVLIAVKRNGYQLSGCISSNWFRSLCAAMRDGLRQISFGDDLNISVGEDLIWVNQEALTEAFAEIGMKFTDADKTGEVFDHKSIVDCTFLKRGFKYDAKLGKWRAPLNLDVIKQMNYWTKKNVPVSELKMTFECSLMEMSIHGKETFDKLAPVLVREVNKHYGLGLIADFNTYQSRSLVHQGFY